MELVYLWVDKYKNIENQGFNFSPRFICKYENSTLTINKKEPEPTSLFSPNINITTIVGVNGSGKSSLLNYIYDFSKKSVYPHDEQQIDSHSGSNFAICESDNLFIKGDKYGIVDRNYEFSINNNPISCVLIEYDNNVSSDSLLLQPINFDKFVLVLSKKDDVLRYFDEKFIFKKFQIHIKRKNIKAFNPRESKDSKFLLMLQEKILKLIQNSIKKPSNIKERTYLIDEFPPNEFMFTTNDIELEIKISFLIDYLFCLDSSFISDTPIDSFFDREAKFFQDLDFDNMYVKVEDFNRKLNNTKRYMFDLKEEISAFKKLTTILKNEPEKINMQSEYIYDKENITEYKASATFSIAEDYVKIKEIIKEKSKIEFNIFGGFYGCFDIDLLSYNNDVKFFELSSGEQSLITKYMLVIYEILFEYAEIILLDEPDVLLHPNWAKNFIKKLIDILTHDTMLKEKKLHIIISTHSPFLLSDIPKENVIFLENGKQVYPDIETFGANIHTLLSHGFFMKDGLIGEFAKSKINEVIDYLNGKDSPITDDDEAQRYIRIIGEPIVKRQLQRMLDSKKLDKVKEIDALKNQIENLQSRLENLEKKS
jgi:ABC-type cobalamin/Fe3+-siderophores transport system ATPase subunit